MSALTDALNRIVNWLQKNPSEKYASVDVLQPGLSYEEIDRIADLPFCLPRGSLRALSVEKWDL